MPPRKPKPEKSEPARFAAGTGPLAESMAAARQAGKTTSTEDQALIAREQDAAERSRVAVQGVTLQRIDNEGAPVGEPQSLGDAAVTLDAEPNDRPEADAPEPGAMMEFETSDPDAVALARELLRIPIPTAVIAQWFPAYFRPEPGTTPWPTCKAFLTPQGLYVYRAAPTEPETFETGAAPTWYAGVDFAETAKPVTGYAAMNAGIPITTSAGQVNVQPYGGCGCNARKLKNWTPTWSRNRISWDDAVKLTDTTAGR